MAFKAKTQIKALSAARTRLAAMKEIDNAQGSPVEYGTPKRPLNTAVLSAKADTTEGLINSYNETLAKAGELKNKCEVAEIELADMASAVLASAKIMFGKDASEVETLGGTRTSERKRITVSAAAASKTAAGK